MGSQAGRTGIGERRDAAAWVGVRSREEASALSTRVCPAGFLADLRGQLETPRGPVSPPEHRPPHPSWYIRPAARLPAPVARLYLDRLAPDVGKRTLAHLDARLARALAATPPAAPSECVESLIGRFAPGPFPPPPSWAIPMVAPARVAGAAGRDEDPGWAAGGEDSVAAAIGRADDDVQVLRGMARIALALVGSAGEAWGLAGAWPVAFGTALLRARNAWKDVLAADREPDGPTAARLRAARSRVLERWAAWAA